MRMVRDLADRIHVLDHGRTTADGEPEGLLKDPENF
jgi:branched-chain amino acid transport system ATP-binding protein